MDALASNHPSVLFSIYIDDIETSCCGRPNEVVNAVHEAVVDLQQAVETDVKAVLSPSKAQVIATNDNTSKRICSRLGSLAGKPICVAEFLGI
eukprot:12074030-Karenia_brevis.AAC.1